MNSLKDFTVIHSEEGCSENGYRDPNGPCRLVRGVYQLRVFYAVAEWNSDVVLMSWEDTQKCLCKVEGWTVVDVPGTPYTFGGGYKAWGPYPCYQATEGMDTEGFAIATRIPVYCVG